MRSRTPIGVVGLAVLAVVSVLGGCAVVNVAPLAAEGRANEVAAQERNQGRTFRVRGVVESTGLRDVEHLEVHGAYFSARGDRVVERQPYVRLRDVGGSSADLVVCNVEARDTGAVGQLAPGMTVAVVGELQRYEVCAAQVLVDLGHCTLR
jgi:hypothetical protein